MHVSRSNAGESGALAALTKRRPNGLVMYRLARAARCWKKPSKSSTKAPILSEGTAHEHAVTGARFGAPKFNPLGAGITTLLACVAVMATPTSVGTAAGSCAIHHDSKRYKNSG